MTITDMTFEQICPKWNELLLPKLSKKMLPQLFQWRDCVVGEAYHYDERYVNKCPTCYMYAVRFYSHAMDEKVYEKRFDPIKEEFAKHWNAVHCSSLEVIQ